MTAVITRRKHTPLTETQKYVDVFPTNKMTLSANLVFFWDIICIMKIFQISVAV